jgi:hypothetical protein
MLNTPVSDPKRSHMTALVLLFAPPPPSSLLEPETCQAASAPLQRCPSHNDVGGSLAVTPCLWVNFEIGRKIGRVGGIETSAA